jgi:type 1 glutamine amidotransferase
MIVDGQNNHDWRATSAYLRTIFEDSGHFEITEPATAPPNPSTPDGKRYADNPEQYELDMSAFRPWFERVDVIVLNYNGLPWPEKVQQAFEKTIEEGKGIVVIHAADNAFPSWANYERMIGLAWRPKGAGARISFDDSGSPIREEAGTGPDSGHGKRHSYQVRMREPDHPIMRGLPPLWMHARDELYHGLRGPAKEMTVLATAYSDPAQEGTGTNEPIAWTVNYGKGRVFHTPMGHDVSAMKCVGFITLVLRGSEWAATGDVTIPIPDDFPTADRVSTRGSGWGGNGGWLVWAAAGAIGVLVVGIVWRRWGRGKKLAGDSTVG